MGELQPLPIPEAWWDTISIDFIVKLPESNGYNAVMNVVDSISKHAHFIPTNTTITALGAARLYLMHMWKHHGLLRQFISNQVLSLLLSSLVNSINFSGSNSQQPPPTTLKVMGRLSMSTKSLNSIFSCLSTSDRMTGKSYYHLPSSSTTIMYT